MAASATPAHGPERIELDEIRSNTAEEAGLSQGVDSMTYVAPNGGYGWICALSSFLINAHTWGINSVSAYFFSHGICM